MQQPPEGQQRPPQPPYYPPGQQYGPPPGQYPQQQPYYPQQPPPKKRRRVWLWIVLGVLAVVVLGCIGTIALISQAAKNTTNTGTIATTVSTHASTSAPSSQHFKVGQTVKVGDTWQVTVNSAKTSQGDEFSTPAAGSQFVIVDITLKNLSSTEQNVSSAVNFSLQDATGQKYNESILSGETPPDGKVEAGALLRGQLSYEVPTSQKKLTFNFEPDLISAGQTVWDITV